MKKRSPRRETPGGGERGWKPPRFGGDFSVALAFPGPYRAGMSSLGFQSVLYGFASIDGVLAERVFIDEESGGLRLLDARFDPGRADLLAFSVSAENDYPEILKVLQLAGVPLRSRDRREEHPFVLAGGIAPSLNPEPLAEFMDFLALGEGEEVLAPVVEALRRRGRRPGRREGVLEELSGIGGIYVPSLYRPGYGEDGGLKGFEALSPAPARVTRRWVRDLAAQPAMSRMTAPGSEFEDLCIVEVNRGCGRGCRFCAAGHLMKPLRHRPLESILSCLEESPSPADGVGLLGSAVGDHPDIVELAGGLVARGRRLSLSSLRIDRLSPELLDILKRGGCRTVTLAPETGSERLRRAVGKPISDGQILDAAGRAAAAGIANLKLYFMVGLPTEEGEDRDAIPALLRKINHEVVAAGRSRGRLGSVAVSLSCFVPKAWTPFQWHPFQEVKALKGALAGLTRQIRKIPNTTVSHDLPKWAYVQALLSRGDRRTAGILEGVHHLGGDWNRALRESSLNPDFFVYRQRERHEIFPWDFVDTGLKRERLWKEYRRALAPSGEEPS